MIKIPNINKKYSQTNESDLLGNIAQTKNIDFDEMGYIKVANRTINIYDETQNASFTTTTALAYADQDLARFYCTTTSNIFYVENNLKTVTKDVRANVPTVGSTSDLVAWQGYVYCSGTSSLRRVNSGGWSANLLSISGGVLCVFKNKNSLALGSDNTVQLIDTSHSVTMTLTLPTEYKVTSMAWANNRMYIGTRHTDGGQAILFEWDGATTSANNGYSVDSYYINSVTSYGGTVALVSGTGRLLQFTGSSLKPLAAFPFYYKNLLWIAGGSTTPPKILHRGMVSDGELLYLNVSSTMAVTSTATEPTHYNFFPGGIWCYDPAVGLYHRYGISNTLASITSGIGTSSVNTTTDIIDIGTSTVPVTGTPVVYYAASGTAIGGLTDNTKYYIIKMTASTMKVATTYADAIANTNIDLTGTGNNSQYFIFAPNNGYGSGRLFTNGAIFPIQIGAGVGAVGSLGKLIMFTGSYISSALTSKSSWGVVADTHENRGYVIYPKLTSSEVTDMWQKIVSKVRGLSTAEDKVIVKYRVVDRVDKLKVLFSSSTGESGTWSDDNTFTTTRDLTLASVGDEVEIQAGSGTGYCLTIESLSNASGTWTVNLTESVQNITAGDQMRYTIDNWKLLGTITSTNTDLHQEFMVSEPAKWLQVKIELRGENVYLEETIIINQTQLPAK